MKRIIFAAVAAVMAASSASAASFTFSFTDLLGRGLTTGTIDGLGEGQNSLSGVTAIVTSAPDPNDIGLVFSGSNSITYGSLTVTGGRITSGYALFINTNQLVLGPSPEIYNGQTKSDYKSASPTQFSAAAVLEPDSWAMFIGGFGLIGGAMRRRKVAVSFA